MATQDVTMAFAPNEDNIKTVIDMIVNRTTPKGKGLGINYFSICRGGIRIAASPTVSMSTIAQMIREMSEFAYRYRTIHIQRSPVTIIMEASHDETLTIKLAMSTTTGHLMEKKYVVSLVMLEAFLRVMIYNRVPIIDCYSNPIFSYE